VSGEISKKGGGVKGGGGGGGGSDPNKVSKAEKSVWALSGERRGQDTFERKKNFQGGRHSPIDR